METTWIRIEDESPGPQERVLVVLWEKGIVDIDIITNEGNDFKLLKNYLHDVTLWMHLPKITP